MITVLLERRLFTILEILAKNKGIALEKLSEELDVSTRSVRTYLKQLQNDIPSNVVEIIKDDNSRYKLNIRDQQRFQELLDLNRRKKQEFSQLNNPEERIEYLINRLAALNEMVTIDELAEEINVGRTTLVNDLKKVDKQLSKYGLVLKRKTNSGIKIEGDEINLRLIILEHICKSYEDAIILMENNNIVSKEEILNIRNEIKINLKKIKFSFTEALIDNLVRYIVVMLLRINNNNKIRLVKEQYKIISESKEYFVGEIIKNIIEAALNTKIDDLETTFIVMPLLVRNAPLYHDSLITSSVGQNITELRKEIFKRVSEFTGLRLEEDEKQVKALEYHLHYALNRLALNLKYKNPMIDEIKEKCKLPYEVAKIAVMVIEERYEVKVGEDEIGYLALHFGTYIEKANEKFIKISKAAVICSTGFGTAQLLIIKLRKLLGENIEFNSFSDGDFSSEIAMEYDMIFTTVDLSIQTDKVVVKITSIFDEAQLKEEIESQVFLYRSNKGAFNEGRYILDRILDKELVFYLKENTLIENIQVMLDRLIERSIVSNDFKKRVIEREKKAGTAFGGYIALPHAVDEIVNEVVVSYGILDRLILVDGKEVGLIILMAIPTEDKNRTEMIVKTYEEIINLSNNKKIVHNLIKTNNYNEFEEVFRRR
ncbi:transcription antitermination protein BlgG [Clostridium zeae]|uniref:Transcription antitermination protein BlgG n=1 Tax=Clostridium zeae TaxID=2759022 RepID=A0ABQ1ECB0_9CLOT|nr:BglG family transcription antiterminator [Clostridium zeae]GFZ32381.1 transcription antitermination protein BlgG [Clostridium zeae]